MAALTDYLENKVIDWMLRAQAFTPPATSYVGLYRATAGVSPRSTAVTTGQTTVPVVTNSRMYRCTTAGTTGAGEPTWGTTNGGTTSDGTAVWTEMSPDFEANNASVTGVEVSGNAYARVSVTSALANWAGTQAAGSTAVSSGTSGTTSNNGTVSFPTPTPAGWGVVAAVVISDALTVGNGLMWGILTAPKTINAGDGVTFPAAALQFQIDN